MSWTTVVPSQRIVRATAAILSWQPVGSDGEPADPGTVTVGVVNSAGTEVIASGTATSGTTTNPRTVALTASQTAQLDILTATWTASGTTVAVTAHEIVGGAYVTKAKAADREATLSSLSTATFVERRNEIEFMFEDACRRAFVPRFRVDRINGTGTDVLPLERPELRRVKWCRIYRTETNYDELDADELSSIPASRDGLAVRTDGKAWKYGRANVVIGYEYGLDQPPPDIVRAAIRAIRQSVNTFSTGIPDRAISWQPAEGGNVVLATPGVGRWVTGIPEVDEALRRHRWNDIGFGA